MSVPVGSPSSKSAERRMIAYHEAGHIVVGTRLGLEVLAADLDADQEGGRGHTQFAAPADWFHPTLGGLEPRERDFVERVVTTFMSGFAAEVRAGAGDPEGSGYDLDLALREWLSYLEPEPRRRPEAANAFYARAKSELEDPAVWQAVSLVAAALFEKGRLDGDRARELVRSVLTSP